MLNYNDLFLFCQAADRLTIALKLKWRLVLNQMLIQWHMIPSTLVEEAVEVEMGGWPLLIKKRLLSTFKINAFRKYM